MPNYLDISIPTSPATTVFPGDPAPDFHWPGWTHEKGNPANVGFYRGGLHHGTHVDAPWHFIKGGRRLDEMPLKHWVGPCEVLDLRHLDRCVDAAALERAGIAPDTKRLLFRTRNGEINYWEQPWNPNFIYISDSAARWCTKRGILLVGLDYLTIDPPTEPTFPAHMELLGKGTLILENICLREIPAGRYELLAAPVKLVGVDGGWCRALLRSL
ncbi:MAG: cyclase family protein [Opitutaceae bacterium]|nr:cyclase family protein [Opitutaceae bacterium]